MDSSLSFDHNYPPVSSKNAAGKFHGEHSPLPSTPRVWLLRKFTSIPHLPWIFPTEKLHKNSWFSEIFPAPWQACTEGANCPGSNQLEAIRAEAFDGGFPTAGWWFQTWLLFSIIYNIWDVILPIDLLHHFSEGLKPPPTSKSWWIPSRHRVVTMG